MKKVEFFVALKYFKGTRKSVFGMLTTAIGVAGITLGVSALIVTLAVMNGFHRDIRSRILGLNPHILLMGREIEDAESVNRKLKENAAVDETSPFVYGQVILKSKESVSGTLLKGIDAAREKAVVPIDRVPFDGEWQGIASNGIVLGRELADGLSVGIGDDVIVVSPSDMSAPGAPGAPGALGALGAVMGMPLMYRFTVCGIFKSGMYDYDSGLAYVSIESAKKVFSMEGITGFGVKLRKIGKTADVAAALREQLPLKVMTWEEMNRNLFAALKLEKFVMFVLLALIIIVACFNIISNLLLLGMEKAKEIGVLSALGMDRGSIRKIFLFEGLITGMLGTVFGTVLGIILSVILKKYQFIKLPPDVYYLDRMPVQLSAGDVLSVVALTVCVTVISAMYPAGRASRMNPVDAIRYG